jgi:DNA-binding NarL/FixJ family response regulator
MTSPLRILYLEDSVADAELVERELMRAGIENVTQRVDTEPAFVVALHEFVPDVILADHAVAQFGALAALALARAVRPTTPVIIVSGAGEHGTAVPLMKAGAVDYILKSSLDPLARAVLAAVAARKPLARLTPRQLEVLRLLAEGHPTRVVARRLKLSVKTVETHRAQLMKRLGIGTLAGLVRFAIRVGLVRD